MRRELLVSVSVLALMTVPAIAADLGQVTPEQFAERFAAPPASGYLEAFGGISYDGSITNALFGGAGRVNWWWDANHSVQVDLYGQVQQTGGTSFSGNGFGVAAHFAKRDPVREALGVMLSLGRTDTYATDEIIAWASAALEYQKYFGNAALYLQGGVTQSLGSSGGSMATIPYVHLQGRFFPAPNVKLTGDAGYSYAFTNTRDVSTVRWGLGAEWRPGSHPFSLFADYQGFALAYSTGGSTTDHRLFGGLRLYIHENSPQDNTLMGATFLDLNPQYGARHTKYIE